MVKLGWIWTYVASRRYFEWKHGQPIDAVHPSTSESPRRVDEPADVHGEGAVDRIHHSKLSKRLHHEIAILLLENCDRTRSVNTYIMPPRKRISLADIKLKGRVLTDDHETDEHGTGTSSLKSTPRTNEETSSDCTTAVERSAFLQNQQHVES